MCPFGDDLRDVLGIDLFFEQARTLDAAQLRLHLTDTLLQLRNGVIAQSCHFLVIILAFSFLQRELRLLQLLLETLNLLDRLAFLLQRQLHGAQLLREIRNLLLDFCSSFPARWIRFLFERLKFHLQLADAAIERINFGGGTI